MKSLLGLCAVLLIISTSVYAAPVVTQPDAPSGKLPLSVKAEVQHLMDLIDQARALNEEPDPAWFDRIDELTGEVTSPRNDGSLDQNVHRWSRDDVRQGGENCAAAFTIPGLPFSESGTLGSTDDCVGQPYKDVFYRYTAITNGTHTFDMCGSSGDTYMRVWTAGTCCSGNSITNDNGCGTDYDPSVTLTLTVGQVVFIECGKYNATSPASSYNFHAYGPIAPPSNDLCTSAISVAVPSSTMGSTMNASADQVPSCGSVGVPTAPGVWFRVNGTGNMMTASLCNTTPGWDTRLSVFIGPCSAVGCVDGNDDYCGTLSQVTWCSNPNVQYFILVHGALNAVGSFQLNISDNGINCHINCNDLTPCSTPAETEPNDLCGSQVDPLVLGCPPDDTAVEVPQVYGAICPATDQDFYRVTVPANRVMTVRIYSGTTCDSLPTSCVVSDVLTENCVVVGTGSHTGWILTNPDPTPVNIYMVVRDAGSCVSRYKITTACCPLENYCAAPINITDVTDFTTTVNTCCATRAVPTVNFLNCGGPAYTAGSSVVFRIHPSAESRVNITATGGDAQIMVFTDCQNPAGTCVASSDSSITNPERLDSIPLAPGNYFIAVSRYGEDCGEILFNIHSDQLLPVEVTSFSATPGRNSVTLHWITASETGVDRFEILRDGRKVAAVESRGNSPTGHRYDWSEDGLDNGRTYHYELVDVSPSGVRTVLRSVDAVPRADGDALITEYALYQNYPNPFNPATQLAFDLPEGGPVTLRVYNLLGRRVAELLNSPLNTGHHVVSFDAAHFPSGLYIYRLEVNHFVAEKKMLLMK